MHGIVLIEGLEGEKLPDSLLHVVESEYEHFLGGTHGLVNIARLRLDAGIAPNIAFALARVLKPAHYYARLNNDDVMYVAFPNTVVRIDREAAGSCDQARAVGQVFEVAREHMRFEEMFELDHPEMHYDAQSNKGHV